MTGFKATKAVLIFLIVTFVGTGGCAPYRGPDAVYGTDVVQKDPVARRFQEPQSDQQTVIESAVELSDKYTKLTATVTDLQKENHSLTRENTRLKKDLEELDLKLKQAQGELAEANSLLMDMLGELNTWKQNVLGFRNEMREAEKAQLEALLKILGMLGADVDTKFYSGTADSPTISEDPNVQG